MWTTLGTPAPQQLAEARMSVHWACQLPAAAAAAQLDAREDYGHTNLGWDTATAALVSRAMGEVRTGLRVHDLTLLVLRGTETIAEFPLQGQTMDAGRSWLARALGDALGTAVESFALFDHDVPPHPVQGGAVFAGEAEAAARAELARWIGNAQFALEQHVRDDSRASEVRLWPHHFDIATLLTLHEDPDAEKSISVNFGVSFGDSSYAQPYVYVRPWPDPPSRNEAPALDVGSWHHDGFFAAVLKGTELVRSAPKGQSERIQQFLVQSDNHCRAMLGGLAGAGKPRRSPKLVWYKAAETDELADGRVKSVTAGHEGICLTRFEGCYSALTNACPHQGGPLGEGSIENGWLRCPWHGWDFHPHTGMSPGEHEDGLQTFAVEERPDGIYVGVEAEAPHERDASDVMAETMSAWGVKWVFGMVGHSNLGLADAIRRRVEDGDLGYIGIRHEGAASFAVSAYGKLTGRPAACLAIAGPGATNLLTGLWDAHVDRAPALALTGQVQSQVLGRGAFQEIDLKAAFGGVAQFSATVLHDSPFAELMTLACKKAILGRGVSHLVFPDEIQTLPAPDAQAGAPEGRMPDLHVAPATASLDKAEAVLREAKRPVIIVGHGARFSMDAVRSFADAHGIPVITTFKAKGQISDSHPLGCGVLGRSGTPVASWFMNEADVLLVLGSSFSNHTGITDYKTIIQVDFEADALGRRHPVDVPVLGEIGITLAALGRQLDGHEGFEDQREEVAARWKIWRDEKESRLSDDLGKGLNSATVFDALTRKAPANAIMTVDVGNNAYSFGRYFEAREQTVLMSGYLGSIGFALPAAMGAWVATQEDDAKFRGRKVISISGDGGLGQYLADLTTWVKYGMDIVHVLLNNGELGKISKEQRVGGWDVWQTSLRNPDFAKYAENCGALGIQVRTRPELDAALDRALAHDGPALIEVIADALLF